MIKNNSDLNKDIENVIPVCLSPINSLKRSSDASYLKNRKKLDKRNIGAKTPNLDKSA